VARRVSHLVILSLLLVLTLGPSLLNHPVSRARVSDLLGSPPVAQAAEQPVPPAPIAAQVAPAAITPTTTPPPLRPATQWLQAFKPTSLLASEQLGAAALAQMPQWTTFRLTGSQVNGRLPVEYPGDGATRLPQRGWVSQADLGPSGPPTVEYLLAAGGTPGPTGVQVPRRLIQAWPQGISAQYAVLLDDASGEILWGRNPYGEVPPASLTKIITSLVALDRTRLADRVNIQVDSRGMWDSTVMGLTPGENLSMETLLYGLMLSSGNDAGIAIAQYIAGSESGFAGLMNAKAAELGLVNSHFVNPHGLDAPGHYSSPFDLVAFARNGMRNPTFSRIVGTRRIDLEGYPIVNLNGLPALYPKADGVKTGFTDGAGRAVVGSAVDNGHRIYVALIRSGNPIPEAAALLEWTFKNFAW
jgi:hypothetical protein